MFMDKVFNFCFFVSQPNVRGQAGFAAFGPYLHFKWTDKITITITVSHFYCQNTTDTEVALQLTY